MNTMKATPKKKLSRRKPQDPDFTVGRALPTRSRRPATVPHARHKGTPPPLGLPPETEVPERRPRRWKRWLFALIVLLFIPVFVIGGWDLRNFSHASQKIFGTGNVMSALATTPLHGGDQGRVNVMVVGYSADDAGHAGADLTDSVMMASLSTNGKPSYLLSVPRDLYVPIEGHGRAKINEAYQDGESSGFNEPGYPAGGIGLLEKTVSDNLGVPIHYYALVDYAAVRGTTDALGGITVNIQSSDPRGIYDPNFPPGEGGPLQLPNGLQKIDGQTALRLVRARGAKGGYGLAQSDFDRTKNQQEVFRAIKAGISTKLLLDPRANSPLLDAIASNVKTDIGIHEVLPLYRLFNRIPSDQLPTITLRDFNGKNFVRSYRTAFGQSALVPLAGVNDYSEIQSAIQALNQ